MQIIFWVILELIIFGTGRFFIATLKSFGLFENLKGDKYDHYSYLIGIAIWIFSGLIFIKMFC